MPVVDQLAQEYSDRVTFVAPAWKGTEQATRLRASQVMPSGEILWGLDADEVIFSAYGIPYQPVSVMVLDGMVVDGWIGAVGEDVIREKLDNLIARSEA